MLKRETHARIYQGEINHNECREIERAAKEKRISLQELILGLIRKYLENWDSRRSLYIERVRLSNGGTRLYLWVPYENCDELNHLMKSKSTYVQELLRK